MRVFNQDKTQELESYDLNKGYLEYDRLLIEIKPAVEGLRGELEIYEDIQIFVPYTEKELAEKEILVLKQNLANTDYQAIKYAEGILSIEEYEEIKQKRIDWRNKINELEII